MKKKQHKINNEVRFPQVRVINGSISTIMPSYDAFQLAISEEKDLILISENTNPPIVRIEDYQKFLYNQEKANKEKKRNSNKNETKEIQLSCNIADNDLNTKAKKAKEFLSDDMKVKCVIQLKGRQKSMPEQGELVMLKFIQMVFEVGSPETLPRMDGGRWTMILKPKK